MVSSGSRPLGIEVQAVQKSNPPVSVALCTKGLERYPSEQRREGRAKAGGSEAARSLEIMWGQGKDLKRAPRNAGNAAGPTGPPRLRLRDSETGRGCGSALGQLPWGSLVSKAK